MPTAASLLLSCWPRPGAVLEGEAGDTLLSLLATAAALVTLKVLALLELFFVEMFRSLFLPFFFATIRFLIFL